MAARGNFLAGMRARHGNSRSRPHSALRGKKEGEPRAVSLYRLGGASVLLMSQGSLGCFFLFFFADGRCSDLPRVRDGW